MNKPSDVTELMDEITSAPDFYKLTDAVMKIPNVATPETPEYVILGKAAEEKLRQFNERHESN